MKARVGCSGWFYWHWKGKFYPVDLPQSKWFSFYAEKFDTVELNSPFYHFPKLETAKTWYKKSPAGFKYCLKVNRLITHIRRFHNTKKLIQDFYAVGDALREKLGCFLFQLPPSLRYSPERLDLILGQLDSGKKNVLEFRHPSWWNDVVYKKLKKAKVVFCSVSGPGLPDDLVKTARMVYVRFHGVPWYSHLYSKDELKDWVSKIRKAKGEVWAYFNNDYNSWAPRNALEFRRMLNGSGRI